MPDGVLFGSSTAHKALRRELVENQRLEAVISMPSDRKAKCFFVPKSEITENDYDLSINKYKTVEYVAEKFPPVSEIMAELEKTEREIQATFAELKEML